MDYKSYALMAILLTSVASLALVSAANAQTTAVTVKTDKTDYKAGETIKISGTVSNVQTGQQLFIQVFNPKNALARADPVPVSSSGSWEYSFPSGGKLMQDNGEYTVKATYRGVSEETTFQFEAGDVWRTINAVIEGQNHPIRFQITGGSLNSIAGDVSLSTLTIDMTATSSGTLTIELPRATIQALTVANQPTGGSDVDFEVFVDTIPATDVDEDSAMSGPANRVLKIPFDAGTEEIEIVGTWLIPEFGAIAAIILAVAIVGIITATRYGKFKNFVPRL
jgi:predicted secreted protein with PEFG-CTERM motif